MPTKEKKEQVNKIAENLEKSNSVALFSFSGLNASAMNSIRNELEELSAEVIVIKNRLLKVACEKKKLPVPLQTEIKGQTAAAFCYDDPVNPISKLYNLTKEKEQLKLKGGFLGNKLLNLQGITDLAKLPPRTVLLSHCLRTIQSPLTRLTSVIQANNRNLVFVLKQIADQKEQTKETK